MNLNDVWFYFIEQFIEAIAKGEREQSAMFFEMSQVIWEVKGGKQ